MNFEKQKYNNTPLFILYTKTDCFDIINDLQIVVLKLRKDVGVITVLQVLLSYQTIQCNSSECLIT